MKPTLTLIRPRQSQKRARHSRIAELRSVLAQDAEPVSLVVARFFKAA